MALLGLCLVASAAAAASVPSPGDAAAAVATVAGHPITVAALRAELDRRGAATAAERTRALEDMVRFELLAAEAKALGLDRDPEVVAAVKRVLVDRLHRDRRPVARVLAVATEAEIDAYVRDHAAELMQPPRRRGSVIALRFDGMGGAEGARARASEIASALAARPQEFGALARARSEDDDTRRRGGDLGWVEHRNVYRWEPAVTEALFAIPRPGETSSVVEGRLGAYVVRLSEIADPLASPATRATARHRLLTEKNIAADRSFYDDLRRRHGVVVDEALVAAQPLSEPRGARERPAAAPSQ